MFELILIFQIFTIVAGLFCVSKGRPAILFAVLANVALAAVNENIIILHSYTWWGIHHNIFYNIFSFVDISLWCFIYWRINFHHKTARNIIIACWFVFMISNAVEFYVINNRNLFSIWSFMTFCIFSIICACNYLFTIFKKEYHALYSDYLFWLCGGALIFKAVFLVNLATMIDPGYWLQAQAKTIFHILQSIAILIYYLFICIAFLTYFYRYRRAYNQHL